MSRLVVRNDEFEESIKASLRNYKEKVLERLEVYYKLVYFYERHESNSIVALILYWRFWLNREKKAVGNYVKN